ncbi:MAG: uracil-DNA glycosylase [Lentisphaeria bacterium]|jgi:uracil-DNA glycosylase|nr:uracil-DNA glycosylase [Lentisphaeria bacterium]MDY0176642.1 uracil-DNA glycosylase [Lentisphaeria bacterium]
MQMLCSDELFTGLPADWQAALLPELDASSWLALSAFLRREYAAQQVYPPVEQLFRAFELTPYAEVKALVLGQDPYHQPGQACGLAFSVPADCKRPPSLRNILKEYAQDLGLPEPNTASLLPWAKNGVLLLNAVLSVRRDQPNSHQNQGWEQFSDAVIRALNKRETGLAFLLWGKNAGQKSGLIDAQKHALIQAPHPSPLSAYRGFFGSKPFSNCNLELQKRNLPLVDWKL